jgi:uncharacterized protein (DUF952 family)
VSDVHRATLSDPTVYKICPRPAWVWARRTGEIMRSPQDARDNCIHLVLACQIEGSLARDFAGQADLVLLAVRIRRLPDGALRWVSPIDGERSPRLHGSLAASYVEQVYELPLDVCGVHGLPSVVLLDQGLGPFVHG